MQTVSKFEAAEAQLTTAIKLFFEDGDDIAIYTLTRASHEILDSLCAKKGLQRGVIEGGLQHVREEHRRTIRDKINQERNYFKHADRDTEETLSWNPKVSEYFIWDATSLHRQLVGVQRIPEIIIYSLWFRLRHDDMWVEANGNDAGLDTLLPDAKDELGNLSKKKFFEVSMMGWRKGDF